MQSTNLNLKLTDVNGSNLVSKNSKMSLETYLKTRLYESVPVETKKIKIKEEDFEIPEYSDYMSLSKNNYNVSQLKRICRFYKLKVSGNKHEIIFRIYNYLKYSNNATSIQKIARKFLVRNLCYMKGPAIINRELCVNSEDFASLDDIKEIPFAQFFSFVEKRDNKDTNPHIYGFDICSLYNYLMKNKNNSKNPYTRNPFPHTLIVRLRRIMRYTKIIGIPFTVNFEQESEQQDLSTEQLFQQRVHNLFQKIDELGYYTNSSWFTDLCVNQCRTFIKELHDIWSYRMNLTSEVQRRIIPPHGNPFASSHINFFHLNHNTEAQIKEKCITIMERFVTSAIAQEDRYLGTSQVLMALTLCSADAAQAMPWLFHSVM